MKLLKPRSSRRPFRRARKIKPALVALPPFNRHPFCNPSLLARSSPSLSASRQTSTMGIRFDRVPPQANRNEVTFAISLLVHHLPFPSDPSGRPINFSVQLLLSSNPSKRTTSLAGASYQAHRGSGFLTFTNRRLDDLFLSEVASQPDTVLVHGSRLVFSRSQRPDDPNLVAELLTMPWRDPVELEKVEKESRILGTPVNVSGFAFGRLLCDGTFSVEEQRQNVLRPELLFDGRRRTISLISNNSDSPVIRIPI